MRRTLPARVFSVYHKYGLRIIPVAINKVSLLVYLP